MLSRGECSQCHLAEGINFLNNGDIKMGKNQLHHSTPFKNYFFTKVSENEF